MIRKLFNPLYQLITTVQVFANSKAELHRTWKDDYEPFNWKLKEKPILVSEEPGKFFRMKVYKTLLKK
jgi:hypothetical protein